MTEGIKAKKVIMLGLDGADPVITNKLIMEDKLPNLKKVIERGTTTDSLAMLGEHPTITPPNWASLATGAKPGTHGITCFWNHESGRDLFNLQFGFNSNLSEAEFIWDAAARAGKKSILFNYPTGWPPTDRENIIVIDGSMVIPNTRTRVGHETIYYCNDEDMHLNYIPSTENKTGEQCIIDDDVEERDFEMSEGTAIPTMRVGGKTVKALLEKKEPIKDKVGHDQVFTPIKPANGWGKNVGSAKEVLLPVNNSRENNFGLIISEDGEKYNKIEFYSDKAQEKPIGHAYVGEWSDWIFQEFETLDKIKMKNVIVPVAYKYKVLDLNEDGSFLELYCSFSLDLSNRMWIHPERIGTDLNDQIGPMLHQSLCMNHEVMAEVQAEMYDWYSRAIDYLMDTYPWDLFFVHVHALDYANHMYQNSILEEFSEDYEDNLKRLYKYYEISDLFVGRILENLDDETLLIICSDHGGMSKEAGCEAPLLSDPNSVGGKVMEDLGYMVVDREKDPPVVIWEKTKAISQRSGYIYINLKGRDPHGCVDPKDYDNLVEQIIDDLLCLKDPNNGRRPITLALKRDDMPILGLYGDHVGDIYFAYNSSWSRVHGTQLTTSNYKGTSVQCLFMIAGPGIKKNEKIKRHVRIIDIVPTLCHLTGIPVPKQAEGGIIYQALKSH